MKKEKKSNQSLKIFFALLVMAAFIFTGFSVLSENFSLSKEKKIAIKGFSKEKQDYKGTRDDTLLDEDFEGAFPPAGWNVATYGDPGNIWRRSDFFWAGNLAGTGYCAAIDSDYYWPDTNSGLRTPSLDLSTYGTASLQFNTYYNDIGSADYAEVRVSTDGGNNWNQIVLYTYDVGPYMPITLSLDAFAGESDVIVEFHYDDGGWDWYWHVDDVVITAAGEAGPGEPEPILIFDNGMNHDNNLGSSQIDNMYPFESWLADDFEITGAETDIAEVHWIGGYWNGNPSNFDIRITFFEDGNGQPGAEIEHVDIPAGDLAIAPAGGYFQYSTVLPDEVSLERNTRYWISIQGVGNFPPQYGVGMHANPMNFDMCMVKFPLLGIPDWQQSAVAFGQANDMAFQLYAAGVPVTENEYLESFTNDFNDPGYEPGAAWSAISIGDPNGEAIMNPEYANNLRVDVEEQPFGGYYDNGTFCWRQDTDGGISTLNELVMHIGLIDAVDVTLNFATLAFNTRSQDPMPSEFEGHRVGDGVAVSLDNINWYRLWQYPASVPDWSPIVNDWYHTGTPLRANPLNISALLEANGHTIDEREDLYIKFQQTGDQAINSDGILWDEILLRGDPGTQFLFDVPQVEGIGVVNEEVIAAVDQGAGELNETTRVDIIIGPSGQVVGGAGGNALPFTEDFEGGAFPPAGWTVDDRGQTGTWELGTYGGGHYYEPPGSGNYFAIADSDAHASWLFDTGLFTPPLDMLGANQVTLTYDRQYQNFAGYDDAYIRTYSGGTDAANLEEVLWHGTSDDPFGGVPGASHSFDPSGYSDPRNVYVEFCYATNGQTWLWSLAVDNIEIADTSTRSRETRGYPDSFDDVEMKFVKEDGFDANNWMLDGAPLPPGDPMEPVWDPVTGTYTFTIGELTDVLVYSFEASSTEGFDGPIGEFYYSFVEWDDDLVIDRQFPAPEMTIRAIESAELMGKVIANNGDDIGEDGSLMTVTVYDQFGVEMPAQEFDWELSFDPAWYNIDTGVGLDVNQVYIKMLEGEIGDTADLTVTHTSIPGLTYTFPITLTWDVADHIIGIPAPVYQYSLDGLLTAVIKDAYGNTVLDFMGETIYLIDEDDALEVFGDDFHLFDGSENGKWDFFITPEGDFYQNDQGPPWYPQVTFQNTTGIPGPNDLFTNPSVELTVQAGPVARLLVSTIEPTIYAGKSFNLTVQAVDAGGHNNITEDTSIIITHNCDATGDLEPSPWVVTTGILRFEMFDGVYNGGDNIYFNKTGTYTITVKSSKNHAVMGTHTFVVHPGDLNYLVPQPNPADLDAQFVSDGRYLIPVSGFKDFQVVGYDAFGNLIPDLEQADIEWGVTNNIGEMDDTTFLARDYFNLDEATDIEEDEYSYMDGDIVVTADLYGIQVELNIPIRVYNRLNVWLIEEEIQPTEILLDHPLELNIPVHYLTPIDSFSPTLELQVRVTIFNSVDTNGEPIDDGRLIFTSGAPNTTFRLVDLNMENEGVQVYSFTIPYEAIVQALDFDEQNVDTKNWMQVELVDIPGGRDMYDFQWNADDDWTRTELHAVSAPPASEVPSFAPAMAVMILALLGGAVIASLYSQRGSKKGRKDEDGVSPVIAIILMVAITIVLAGVLWLWVSGLVDTQKSNDIEYVDTAWESPTLQNDYQLIIENVKDKEFSVEDLEFSLMDGNKVDKSMGQHKVTAIYGKSIDNETIVSFHDGDHDGYLSTGDRFIIKSEDHENYDGTPDPGEARAGYYFALKTKDNELFEVQIEQ